MKTEERKNDTAQPSDEELYRLLLQLGGMAAVREAVEKPLRAEIERLTEECESVCAELNKLKEDTAGEWVPLSTHEDVRRQRDALRAKMEAAEKQAGTLTKANELNRQAIAQRDAEIETLRKSTTCPARVRFTVTAEELKREWSKCLRANTQPGEFSANPESFLTAFSDYLAAHAVIDAPDGVPSAEELVDELDKSDVGKNYPANRREDVEYILDLLAPFLQPAASVDDNDLAGQFRKGYEAGMKEERERLQDAPIADANTLEQLAEIGWNVDREEFNRLYGSENYRVVDWQAADDIDKKAFRRAVTAILRAARPEIVASYQEVANAGGPNGDTDWSQAILDLCNSRIRFRVEVPDAPSDDTRQQQREEARELLKRLSDSLMTTHGIDARKRAKWAGLLAELDAALEEKP